MVGGSMDFAGKPPVSCLALLHDSKLMLLQIAKMQSFSQLWMCIHDSHV